MTIASMNQQGVGMPPMDRMLGGSAATVSRDLKRIYENKNILDFPAVFAGLFSVIVIGLAVENLNFRRIELHTVRK